MRAEPLGALPLGPGQSDAVAVSGLTAAPGTVAGRTAGGLPLNVKTVQARLRHGSAKTTLDTYGHLWPDKDESTKAVIDALVDSKFQGPADSVRTEEGAP